MGLDTTHDCWHGAYSAFGRWREMLAKVAGLPPLDLMEGFYGESKAIESRRHGQDQSKIYDSLPIKWESLKDDIAHIVINHSDCDGEIPWQDCELLAQRLEELKLLMPDCDVGGHIGHWRDKTQRFIDGLKLAFESKENVEFH